MNTLMIIGSAVAVLSLLNILFFQWKEGNDERGKFILHRTYSVGYSLLLGGVLLMLLFVNWSEPAILIGLTSKDTLFLTLCLSALTAGISLQVLKRKY